MQSMRLAGATGREFVVPPEKRGERIPCRHIPVSPEGATLLELYRGATDQVIEEAMTYWLQREIAKLENEEQPA